MKKRIVWRRGRSWWAAGLSVLLIAACNDDGRSNRTELEKLPGAWGLFEVVEGDQGFPSPTGACLVIEATSREEQFSWRAYSGCNWCFGDAVAHPESGLLEISASCTERACPPAEAGEVVERLLTASTGYWLAPDGQALDLSSSDGLLGWVREEEVGEECQERWLAD